MTEIGFADPVVDGLLLRICLTPGASQTRIGPAEQRADGSTVLRARVRAVPEKGKANAELRQCLAKSFNVARSAINVVSGQTSRSKTVHIRGDTIHLFAHAHLLALGETK